MNGLKQINLIYLVKNACNIYSNIYIYNDFMPMIYANLL